MKRLFRVVTLVFACLFAAQLLFILVTYLYSRYLVEYEYEMVGWPDKEDHKPPIAWQPDDPKRVRILAIEGGAMLGLADLEVLKAIERRSGKRIHELFDFVAGASTGAIISTLLLYPQDATGRPMTAADAADVYQNIGAQLLSAPLYHRILTGNGLFGPRMVNHARILEAHSKFKEGTFRDLLRPAMFPSFSQQEGGLKLFHNWHPQQSNLYLAPLVSAVTSAPTYFPAVKLRGGDQDDDFIVDPALVLNSPGDFAYLHARTNVPNAREFVVVSMGTTWDIDISTFTSVRGGLFEWAMPMVAMIFNGQSSVSRLSLERHALMKSDVEVATFNLHVKVPRSVDGFSASDDEVAFIRDAGKAYARDHAKLIDAIIELLTNPDASLTRKTVAN